MNEHKFQFTQAIIIRKDLGMSKGKLAVQAAHASIGAYRDADEDVVESWFNEGQRKISLQVGNLFHLQTLAELALILGVSWYLVEDFGLTEFHEPTITCLGLGPCSIELMNKLIEDLKLY